MTLFAGPNGGGVVDLPDSLIETYKALGYKAVGGESKDKPFSQLNKAELIEFGNTKFDLGLEDSLSKAELVELIEAAQAE